jgi:putative transposase
LLESLRLPTPYFYRRNLPHILQPDAPHFVTWKTLEDRRLKPPERDIVFEHCMKGHLFKFWLHAFVVMPTHVHIVFTPLRAEHGEPYTLAEITRGIKGASSRRINQRNDASGSLWQDESLDRVVRDNEFEATVFYIMENPVAAGLASVPSQYKWLWVNPAQPGEAVPHHYRPAKRIP